MSSIVDHIGGVLCVCWRCLASGRYRVTKSYVRSHFSWPGTTNETHGYLKSRHGNRRFWPIKFRATLTSWSLSGDRDQLFAEAKLRNSNGAPLFLSPELSGEAEAVAETRREVDPLEDVVCSTSRPTSSTPGPRKVSGRARERHCARRRGDRIEGRLAARSTHS